MSAWSVCSVESTTRYRESQVLLAVTLWLSGVVIDQTFTLAGVDVHAAYSLITATYVYSRVKFSRLVSTMKFF